jgi:uncharacterized protein YcbX
MRQGAVMNGRTVAIYRYPVKGFSPEPVDRTLLQPGRGLAFDRLYAVENGPSGFDADNPVFIPKQKFTVLASLPRVAAARTRFDDATGVFKASAPGLPAVQADLETAPGRAALEAWLEQLLGDDARRPLKVIRAPQAWRFFDHPQGHVSVLNLASVRDLSQRMGVELDPRRFRANLHVEGWPAWAENQWTGQALGLGAARVEVFKPIIRCAATHVHPDKAERDADVTKALFDHFGHMFCGVYVKVTAGGDLHLGDAVTTPATAAPSLEEYP